MISWHVKFSEYWGNLLLFMSHLWGVSTITWRKCSRSNITTGLFGLFIKLLPLIPREVAQTAGNVKGIPKRPQNRLLSVEFVQWNRQLTDYLEEYLFLQNLIGIGTESILKKQNKNKIPVASAKCYIKTVFDVYNSVRLIRNCIYRLKKKKQWFMIGTDRHIYLLTSYFCTRFLCQKVLSGLTQRPETH